MHQSEADTLAHWFLQGRAAVEQENYARAERVLRPLIERKPAYRFTKYEGTASYWLGRAYFEAGRDGWARDVWQEGLKRALMQRQMDLRSAEAFIRTTFDRKDTVHYAQAARTFLMVLEYADVDLDPDRAAVLAPHIAQFAPLLSEQARSNWIDERGDLVRVEADNDGGKHIAAWWRAQDPLPATPRNERLIEHLKRAARARAEYGDKRFKAGVDGRGMTLIRYGEPTHAKTINFYTSELSAKIDEIRRSIGNNLIISESDFADNEFWLYTADGSPYYFLFVERGNGMELGETADLIPHRLRGGDGDTGRGGAKADVMLEALRAIYQQLASYHLDFGARYAKVQGYLERLEEAKIRHEQETGRTFVSLDKRTDYSSLIDQPGGHITAIATPDIFGRSMMSEARREDQTSAARRNRRLPPSIGRATAEHEQLPVALRVARFLDEDGATQTEFYWGMRARDLAVDSEREQRLVDTGFSNNETLVAVTLRHETEDHRPEAFSTTDYILPLHRGDDEVVLPRRHPAMTDTSGRLYHVGLQWDQHALRHGGESMQQGPRLKTGVMRVDSLAPLGSEAGTLEMSDLVPFLLGETEISDQESRVPGKPYPFHTVDPSMQLGLYFEVYNLSYGHDDQAHYTVELEVEQHAYPKGLDRLLAREGDVKQMGASSTFSSASRRASQYILVDLEEHRNAREIILALRITDQTSSQEVVRRIPFKLRTAGE